MSQTSLESLRVLHGERADGLDLSAFDEAPVVASSTIAGLLAKAEELIRIESQIADIEQLLQALSSKATELKTKTIPDKMAEVGLSEFTTPAGNTLKVENFLEASFPKKKEERERVNSKRMLALEKMEGGSAIIKTEISVFFEKSQHNVALATLDDLRKKELDASISSGVNPQTFKAFVNEALASGAVLDQQELGVFVGRKTKVIMAKEKKK